MTYQPGDYEACHAAPAWRDRADFIIAADISEDSRHREWEQIWAKKLGEHTFELCCVPFFTYGMALGDVVETNGAYVIQRIIKQSGQRTVRIWFGSSPSATPREGLQQALSGPGMNVEWHSDNLLALSISREEDYQAVIRLLEQYEHLGHLTFELGN
jgi:Domain of unknown function (DUF4265)